MRLLVADDNIANRMIARAVLEREGHEVSLAASGVDAIELSRVRGFDAVLLDILMPGMDGLRTIRRLKGSRPALPVFALTSYDSPADIERYRLAGFDGVIAKPLNPGDFERVLGQSESGEQAFVPSTESDEAQETPLPLLDWRVIEGGVGRAEPETSAVVLRHYRSSLGVLIRTMQQTLPGALALDPTDLRAFRDALHALKSASAMIGLSRAPAIAGRLRNAPPTELKRGVADLLRSIRESLPALESALAQAPARVDAELVAFRQVGAGMQVGGQHETEPAHDDQNNRAAI